MAALDPVLQRAFKLLQSDEPGSVDELYALWQSSLESVRQTTATNGEDTSTSSADSPANPLSPSIISSSLPEPRSRSPGQNGQATVAPKKPLTTAANGLNSGGREGQLAFGDSSKPSKVFASLQERSKESASKEKTKSAPELRRHADSSAAEPQGVARRSSRAERHGQSTRTMDEVCEVCGRSSSAADNVMVTCTGCDRVVHQLCDDPLIDSASIVDGEVSECSSCASQMPVSRSKRRRQIVGEEDEDADVPPEEDSESSEESDHEEEEGEDEEESDDDGEDAAFTARATVPKVGKRSEVAHGPQREQPRRLKRA